MEVTRRGKNITLPDGKTYRFKTPHETAQAAFLFRQGEHSREKILYYMKGRLVGKPRV